MNPSPTPAKTIPVRPAAPAADVDGGTSLPRFTQAEHAAAKAQQMRLLAEAMRLQARAETLDAECYRRHPTEPDMGRAEAAARRVFLYENAAKSYADAVEIEERRGAKQ